MSGQSHKQVRLRRFMPTDAATIVAWPTYPAEFAELDYALRKDGWIAELCNQPDTWIHVAELSGELLAFTTLASTTQGEAEFRIALRADMLGQGLGYILTEQTLAIGFHEIGLQLIHLIVRKNNPRAIELYRRMKFSHCGERQIIANGMPTDFLVMELLARDFIGPMRTRSQIVSHQEEHPNNKPTHRNPMNPPVTKGIHHLGLTVSKLEESANFFTSLLGWKEVRRNPEYPAIYVSDGVTMVSLWSHKESPANPFDKNKNVGLHHVALQVESEADLIRIHTKLVNSRTPIEFAPEQLGKGPAKHMMCLEPSGIRIEFTWPGN